jgi:hypothetical protein
MLETLIGLLKTSCATIPNIKQVFAYPVSEGISEYPALVFFPDTVDNSFESNNENFKIYNFAMFIEINIAGTTTKDVYENILPKTFDDVVQHFDTNWNMATVDGHRVWAKVSANIFGLSVESANKTATVQMTLQIKALTDN